MVKINKLFVEEVSYIKDGVEKKYYNLILDLTSGDYRYQIPLSCVERGKLSNELRNSLPELVGVYNVTFVE